MTKLTSTILGIAIASIALGVGSLLVASGIFTGAQTQGAEVLHIKGKVDMVVYDELGNVKEERHLDNLIVNSGFQSIADRVADVNATNVANPFNYIAIGTNGAAAQSTDTALGTEVARIQDSSVIYNTSTKKITIDATFGPGTGTGNIQESGLFNANSSGDMLARQAFASINKGASDSLTITWTITLS
jgi:hypothetical protein